jgi:hypothetical protein
MKHVWGLIVLCLLCMIPPVASDGPAKKLGKWLAHGAMHGFLHEGMMHVYNHIHPSKTPHFHSISEEFGPIIRAYDDFHSAWESGKYTSSGSGGFSRVRGGHL